MELNEEIDEFQIEEKSIINKGEITRDEIIKASRRNLLKGSISFSVIGLIVFLVGFVLLITWLKNKDDNTTLYYSFAMMILGALVIGLPFIISLFLPSMLTSQNAAIMGGFKYKFLFTNNSVDITLVSDVSKTHTSLNYRLIKKVKVYGDIAFIYLNSNVVYMIKLSNFETKDDLNWAMKQMYYKFKVIKND